MLLSISNLQTKDHMSCVVKDMVDQTVDNIAKHRKALKVDLESDHYGRLGTKQVLAGFDLGAGATMKCVLKSVKILCEKCKEEA